MKTEFMSINKIKTITKNNGKMYNYITEVVWGEYNLFSWVHKTNIMKNTEVRLPTFPDWTDNYIFNRTK